MYFYNKNVSQAPCGGKIHFQSNSNNNNNKLNIETIQLVSSVKAKLTHSNGEETKFTHESGTCKGTSEFWCTQIKSR